MYAVVLGPAVAVTVMMLILTVTPPVKNWIVRAYSDRHVVELAKEMSAHAAFYGAAVASLLGYKNEPYGIVFAALWFAIATRIAYVFALRIKLLKIGENHA